MCRAEDNRLIEQFKKTSQEVRETTCLLLDLANTDQYRLMKMYAKSPNDYNFSFRYAWLDSLGHRGSSDS